MHGRSLAATLATLITLALPATASAAMFTVTHGDRHRSRIAAPGDPRRERARERRDPHQIVFASGVTR